MNTKLTAEEAIKSLKYDEIQFMKKNWGVTPGTMENDLDAFLFALVHIIERRENDKLTKKDFTDTVDFGVIGDYYAPDEVDDEGKDSTDSSLNN